MGQAHTEYFYPTSSCAELRCASSTYLNAADGLGLLSKLTSRYVYIGQVLSGGTYTVYQQLVAFDTSWIPDDATITGATLRLNADTGADYSTTDFTIEARACDWGPTSETSDWQDRSELSALTLLATYNTANGWPSGLRTMTSNGDALKEAINKTGQTRIVLCSDRHRQGTTPTGNEFVGTYYPNTHQLEVSYAKDGVEYVAVIFGSQASGWLECVSSTYANARSGSGTKTANTTVGYATYGQRLASSQYTCYEAFLSFDTSVVPDDNVITAATLYIGGGSASTYSGPSATLQARLRDYGSTLTTDDWVAGADLSSLPLLATLASSDWPNSGTSYKAMSANGDALKEAINKTGYTRMVLATDRLAAGTAPTGYESSSLDIAPGSTGTMYLEALLVIEHQPGTVDDDLSGSHQLLTWVSADDLPGSHRVLVWATDDLPGSHQLHGWLNDDLPGGHRILVWTTPDDLPGSHRVLVWATDDLPGSHYLVGVDDLPGAHRLLVWTAPDELGGSHRLLVFTAPDDLSGAHAIVVAAPLAVEPPLLYVPQLALLLDDADSRPIDLLACGADPASVRFSNSVIGGHGQLTVEIPQGPSRLLVNGLHRGMDARLFDRGVVLHAGKVLSVAGEESGKEGTTTVTIGGPLELAETERTFRWIWVDADYSRWEQVSDLGPVNEWGPDAYNSWSWYLNSHDESAFEVRTDGELFIGAPRGTKFRGDAWYNVAGRSQTARARIAYRLDRLLPAGSFGDALGMRGIRAFRCDWRANTGTRFRARILAALTPWSDINGVNPLLTQTAAGAASGNDAEWAVGLAYPCLIVELAYYSAADSEAAGEFIQLLHPRVLVRPDGPGKRTWSVGDGLPRLDECMADVMVDPDGRIATELQAEAIGEGLQAAAVDGPTRRQALEQLAELDEDEDGTGEPLEYGIWEGESLRDYVAVIARRKSAPQRKDRWLAIDTRKHDVDVRIEYEDAEAPDYVEVRFQYMRTNLLRHSSPAAPGYWEERGYADDRPYDWVFTETGSGAISNVLVGSERRWKLHAGSASGLASMAFPKPGTYPLVAAALSAAMAEQNRLPFPEGCPLRFQAWMRRERTSSDAGVSLRAWYYLDADNPRGDDWIYEPTLAIDDQWRLVRFDWRPDPSSAVCELALEIRAASNGGASVDLWWRNAQLYYLVPEGTELSVWYPRQPVGAGYSTEVYELPFPATIWAAWSSARKFWRSFRRGAGKGTITARGILHDMRGREVPVSRIRGGWWATIVDDPRCTQPLYITGVSDVDPYGLEAELLIGGEMPPWSAREPLYERRTFGRYAEWRGFRPLARRRR